MHYSMDPYKNILSATDYDFLTIDDYDYKHQLTSKFSATRVTTLMKLIILTKKYSTLNQYISLYKHQINIKNSIGWTPLYLTCAIISTDNDIITINNLLNCGADVNMQTCKGNTVFHSFNCYFHNNIPTSLLIHAMRVILKTNNVNLNIMNNGKYTALYYHIIREKSREFQNILLEYIPCVNQIINLNEKHTALHCACITNNTLLIEKLLKLNANPNIADNNGHFPIHLYLMNNGRSLDIIQMFIYYGANLDNTIYYACKHSPIPILELLLKQSKSQGAINSQLETPLSISVLRNTYHKTKILLENGANPNEISKNIPLIVCCKNGWLKCIKLLLKYGADPNICDDQKNTPFTVLPKTSEKAAIIKLLIEFGGLPKN
jgi:ankyrin repeat protein